MITRGLVLVSLVLGMAGCATESGSQSAQGGTARAKAHTELAAAYYENGNYKVALEELGTALRADSRYVPAYNMRGLVHMVLHEDQEAESDFQRSLDLDADNSEAHNNYGWFLCQRGRAPESVNHFLEAVQNPLYTTPEKAYLNAGICSRKAGKLQDADRYLQRALVLQPGMPEALGALAEVSFVTGDYAGARSYFARFERAVGASLTAENLLLAVRIEQKLGNRALQARYAAQLRRSFPDSREAQLVMQIR